MMGDSCQYHPDHSSSEGVASRISKIMMIFMGTLIPAFSFLRGRARTRKKPIGGIFAGPDAKNRPALMF